MRFMISGGGTGGHIYPALAIAEALRRQYPQSEILYVGNPQGMEHELAEAAGHPFCGVHVAGFTERGLTTTLRVLTQNIRGLADAKKELKRFRPDLVVGTGGYVCGPLLLAASRLHIPTLLHEQNAIMGKTNHLLSRRVDKICLTFPIAGLAAPIAAKCELTGLPVRQAILTADRREGRRLLGFAADRPLVLLTGGSQGARHLNQAFAGLWRELLAEGVQILHLCGEKLYAETAELAQAAGLPLVDESALHDLAKTTPRAQGGFLLLPYLHKMEYALAACDVIVGRAGASFLAEVTTLGRAAVLVPYPFAAGDHQTANARALADAGAALLLPDAELCTETLRPALQKLLFDIQLRDTMAANSAALGHKDAAAAILRAAASLMR